MKTTVFTNHIHIYVRTVLLGLLFFASAGVLQVEAAAISWNDSDWTLYDTITIESDNIDGDLTDFPVYVDLADLGDAFWNTSPMGTSTVGTDIRVTTDAEVPAELPRELVSASSTAQTGELHFKADNISSTTDTVFRIYYNGTTTGDYATSSTYGSAAVWDDYTVVWHMNSLPQVDSAENIPDTHVYGTFQDPAGLDSDGNIVTDVNDELTSFSTDVGSGALEGTYDSWSTMMYWDPATGALTGTVGQGTVGNNGYTIDFIDVNANSLRYHSGPNGTGYHTATSSNLDLGKNVLHVTYDDTTGVMSLYVDGELASSTGAASAPTTNWDGFTIYRNDGTHYEARGAQTSFSAARIKAEHVNLSTTTDFYTVVSADIPAAEWSDPSWTLYDIVTIDADNIDADLTDFPVYIDLADLTATFWSTTPSASSSVGTDIRVTTNGGSPTELPRELVSASSTAQTGELHFKADSISATADTVFRIYYNGVTTGDYAADATYGSENVWSNDYVGVWHMEEDPSSVDILDSTNRGMHATSSGTMTSTDRVDGSVGKAIDFDGVDDVLDAGVQTLGLTSISVSSWIEPDDYGEGGLGRIFDVSDDNSEGFATHVSSAGSDVHFTSVTNANDGAWSTPASSIGEDISYHTVTQIADVTNLTENAEFYIDGTSQSVTEDVTPTGSYVAQTATSLLIGNQSDGTRTFDGYIDELRLSSTTRSSSWVAAEHLNQATSTDFYSVISSIATQEWNATSWTHYDTITIESDNIDDDFTDFPVYVDLSDLSATFWSMTPTGGATVGTDIRVTTDAEVPAELPRELVSASSTAQTGELHFKADSISSTTDTVFRIYYNGTTNGDYTSSETYGAQNVWSNEYIGVWHLNEDGNSVAGGYNDSTSYNNDGTGVSMTAASDVGGKLGQAQDFDGSVDYISIPDAVDNRIGTKDFSVAAWIKPADANASKSYLGKRLGSGTYNQFTLSVGTPNLGSMDPSKKIGYFLIEDYGGSKMHAGYTTNDVADGDWHMVYFSRSGTSDPEFHIDGSSVAGTVDSNDGTKPQDISNTQPWAIGSTGGGQYFDSPIDELRIASTTRSDAWIAAEHLNQATSTDFYTTAEVAPVLTMTLADSDGGQVSNTFSSQSKTDTELFSFKLIPVEGTISVTNLELSLLGAKDFVDENLASVELYIDVDNDAEYDSGTDTLVGSGAVSVSGQSGNIDFTTDFSVATATNYLIIGDTISVVRGAGVVVELNATDVSTIATVSGNVSTVKHSRGSSGGKSYSGGGSSPQIGDPSPPGDGDVGGGTNEGGELIGGDLDYKTPTADSGAWTNGSNAYDGTDGTYATDNAGAANSYSDHAFAVPGVNTVEGIIVKMEISGTTAAGDIGVELSWNGGTNWTSSKSTPTLTTTDAVVEVGGASDTWGRVWSASEFGDANFAVRLTGNPSSNTVQVDEIQVRVYHQASGGGSGGGGAI